MWKDNLQRLFRHRKITPSANVWEQLEAQLAAHEAVQAHQNKRKVWYYAAAASLLLALGTTYLLKEEKATIAPQNPVITTAKSDVRNEGLPTELAPTVTVAPLPQAPTRTTQPSHEVDKEVDSLLSGITPDALIASVMNDIETNKTDIADEAEIALLKDLEKLSANDLLLMASTEISLEKYVESQYNPDNILSDTEVEIFKEKVQRLLDKIVAKFNEARLALKQ